MTILKTAARETNLALNAGKKQVRVGLGHVGREWDNTSRSGAEEEKCHNNKWRNSCLWKERIVMPFQQK